MNLSQQRPVTAPSFPVELSPPVIPTRRMPAFMGAMWVLAVLMLVGIGYSFWRISVVPTPMLEVVPTDHAGVPTK